MKTLAAMLLLMLALRLNSQAEPQLLNGIAVIVNDAVITYKEIYSSIAEEEALLERRHAGQPQVLEEKLRALRADRTEQLVEAQLILNEFNSAGYKLPETYIEDMIDKDVRSFGDRLTLTKTLQAQGITYETYRKRVRERVILDAMRLQHVPRDPVISPSRIEKYYLANPDQFRLPDQVKLRMIVLTNRPNETIASTRKLAQEIIGKLDEGAAFDEMAKIYSQGSQSAEGGDWGWTQKSVLREDLAEKAFSMRAGERSGVIEAPDGCFIMLVEEVRPAHVRPLTDVREEIESTLKSEESKRLHKRWIDRLRAKSFIRYF